MTFTELVQKMLNLRTGKIMLHTVQDLKSPSIVEPICEDLEGKGVLRVITANQNGEVIAFTEEGEFHWKYKAKDDVGDLEQMFLDVEVGNGINTSPVAEDINDDDKKEIIFGTELGLVYALSSKGKKIWVFKAGGAIRGGIGILDINNDYRPEIVFGSNDKNIYILNNKGKLIKKIFVGSKIESTPVLFNGLIVTGTNDGNISAYNVQGEKIWSIKTESKITAKPVIAQLRKGQVCLLVGSTDNSLYCIDENGKLLWKFKTNGSIYSKVLVSDLNGDGEQEIVFGSCDNKIYVLNSAGVMIWNFETDFWVVGSPLLMDIDNDNRNEVILGSYDTQIYILSTDGTYNLGYIPGISGIVTQEGNYSEIPTHDPGEIVGKKIWMLKLPGIVVGCCKAGKNLVVQTKEGKLAWVKHERFVV